MGVALTKRRDDPKLNASQLSNLNNIQYNTEITIKAAFADDKNIVDIRKLKLASTVGFSTVKACLKEKFADRLGDSHFLVQYVDLDGDTITITDADWLDVIASACKQSLTNSPTSAEGSVVRVTLVPYNPNCDGSNVQTKTISPHSTFRHARVEQSNLHETASYNLSNADSTDFLSTFERTFEKPYPYNRPGSAASTVHPDEILGHHKTTLGDWTLGKLLGQGGYGKVYRAMINSNGALMAVKQIEVKKNMRSKEVKEELKTLEREISLLKQLQHPMIVRYLGMELQEEAPCYIVNILMEFVAGGSISSLLHDQGKFAESAIQNYTKQILLGLDYLHENEIVHRDIKGANILVTKTGSVKISDFGASKKLQDIVNRMDNQNNVSCHSVRGTVQFMAPEVCAAVGSFKGSDIWSLGCTVLEMATCNNPYPDITNDCAVLYNVGNNRKSPSIPDDLSELMKDFLRQCFHHDYNRRPSARELLRHPWFEGTPRDWPLDQSLKPHQIEGMIQMGSINRSCTSRGTSTEDNGTSMTMPEEDTISPAFGDSPTSKSNHIQFSDSSSQAVSEPVTPAEVKVRLSKQEVEGIDAQTLRAIAQVDLNSP